MNNNKKGFSTRFAMDVKYIIDGNISEKEDKYKGNYLPIQNNSEG